MHKSGFAESIADADRCSVPTRGILWQLPVDTGSAFEDTAYVNNTRNMLFALKKV